ncbi:hypothetical protein F5878DRAFT_404239 [Lentinula raphanica]|uniref:Uncharacterized protein n=1 Tax=Lentinula raphanica TaxID=153919 RepID=A0AA38PGP4_9AGAR|nr:hypothetical protein F5878DRAFT_404239 [Lentinula raphanica]
MRLRAICSLFSTILLGVVFVTASPLPPNDRRSIHRRKSPTPISFYVGLWHDELRWLEQDPKVGPVQERQAATPVLCFNIYGCIGYIEREKRAFVRYLEITANRLPTLYFAGPLSKPVSRKFKDKKETYFESLTNIELLQRETKLSITDRRSYFQAAIAYMHILGLMKEEDLSTILAEILETMRKLQSAAAHIPPALNPPPPTSNPSASGSSLVNEQAAGTNTRSYLHQVLNDPDTALSKPTGGKGVSTVNEPENATKNPYFSVVLDGSTSPDRSGTNKRPMDNDASTDNANLKKAKHT